MGAGALGARAGRRGRARERGSSLRSLQWARLLCLGSEYLELEREAIRTLEGWFRTLYGNVQSVEQFAGK